MIRLAWKLLGPERFSMVTDCMAALGMGPGRHLLGDFEVIVDGTSARLSDGTLAGSILSLDEGVRNLVRETGCGLEDALATVTTTPARLLGMAHERGRIDLKLQWPTSFCFRRICKCRLRSRTARWSIAPRPSRTV